MSDPRLRIRNGTLAALQAGMHPKAIMEVVEAAILAQGDWALWGDGWHKDTVCSVCGSSYSGLCRHRIKHEVILRREFEQRRKP
jgi:hypothetical protein